MKTIRIAIAVLLTASLASVVAWASEQRTYYRPCCVDDPERHGCGIAAWSLSVDDANEAGAEHARKTSGHSWTIEEVTR